MRILAACSLGGSGHLNPLLPFLEAARRRGDEGLVIGPPGIEGLVEETGFPFQPGGEPPEEEVAPIREQLPVVPAAEAAVLGDRELFGRMATQAMLPAMERTFASWGPDLVLREPCEYASAVLAERTGTPCAQVAISFAEVEAGAIGVARPAIDDHEAGLADALMAMPYLTRFPPSLDPPVFAATMRYRDGGGPAGAPLPDWWDGREGPLLYVTFGTVLGYMSYAADVFRTVLGAVAGFDARVLLTVGRKFDPGVLGPLPANVHVEPWVDQDRVLGHTDAVVCHGGSGTVLGALAAGVPLVLVPLFADQFENSRRVAAQGAGEVVERPDPRDGSRSVLTAGDAPRITGAVEAVLTDEAYRIRAGRSAAEIAALPTAAELLERLVGGA